MGDVIIHANRQAGNLLTVITPLIISIQLENKGKTAQTTSFFPSSLHNTTLLPSINCQSAPALLLLHRLLIIPPT